MLADISGATQHVFVDPINLVDAGPELIQAWRSGTRDEAATCLELRAAPPPD